MQQFFYVSGVVIWIFLMTYTVLRLIFGKNWMLKVGGNLFLGFGLIQSAKKLKNEIQEGDIKDDTVTEVGVRVFWRLTRIGVLGLIIAGLPVWLLFNQNRLIDEQNDLLEWQTELVKAQTDLLENQDEKLALQNQLFGRQNDLFVDQNERIGLQSELLQGQNYLIGLQKIQVDSQISLLAAQNSRIDTQNYRVSIQNNLLEADRRSSLVYLMSNILDEVSREISSQATEETFTLSSPLKNRIIALSRAFKPYRLFQDNHLSADLVSPERGQLFIALMSNRIDSMSQNEIASNGDFSFGSIGQIAMPNGQFKNAKFNNTVFTSSLNNYYSQIILDSLALLDYARSFNKMVGSNAGLPLYRSGITAINIYGESFPINVDGVIGSDFRGANFFNADLNSSKLDFAFLNNAIMKQARLSKASLRGAMLDHADLNLATASKADFLFASLASAILNDAIFDNATLKGANLKNAKAVGAKFRNANLESTIWENSDLRFSDFSYADLENSNLSGANFAGTILDGANLSNCNLSGTKELEYSQLIRAESLYNCKGLNVVLRQQILNSDSYCLLSKEGCK